MLRFKIDENLPREAASLLAGAGHDAVTVHDQNLVGRPDATLASVCRQEKRAVVTLDLDFSDIRVYPPADFAGIIVLRPNNFDKFRTLSILERLLPVFEREPLAGRLWIVNESSIRVRE